MVAAGRRTRRKNARHRPNPLRNCAFAFLADYDTPPALGRVDELETRFVRQKARDEGKRSAERIDDTFKEHCPSDRCLLSHPKDRACDAQSQDNPVLTMHQHRLRQLYLILNITFPGETHLQFVHTA